MGEIVTINSIKDGMLAFTNQNGQVSNMPITGQVKPEYIRPGLAEVSIQNGFVTYVRMQKKEVAQSQVPSPIPAPVAASEWPSEYASYYISYAKDLAVAGLIKVEEIPSKTKELVQLAKEV